MDRFEMRVYKPKVGDVFKLNDIRSKIVYDKKSSIKCGKKLFVLNGKHKMFAEDMECVLLETPKMVYIITEVKYKSRFKIVIFFSKDTFEHILIKRIL